MNDKELLDLLAEDAPVPAADYPLTTLNRARRARLTRNLTIGGAGAAVVVLSLLAMMVFRPVPAMQPAAPTVTKCSLYLRGDVTAEQRAAIENAIRGMSGVTNLVYVSQEAAYIEFKEQFPDLAAEVTVSELPESFRFTVPVGANLVALEADVRRLKGVDTLVFPERLRVPSENAFTVSGEADAYRQVIRNVIELVGTDMGYPRMIYLVDHYCDNVAEVKKACNPQPLSAEMCADLDKMFGGGVQFVNKTDGLFEPATGAVRDGGVIVALGRFPDRAAVNAEVHLSVTRGRGHGRGVRFAVSWDATAYLWQIGARTDSWVS